MIRFLSTVIFCVAVALAPTNAAAELNVKIAYLRYSPKAPPTLSSFDPDPADLGLAGARVGISDNATTGTFLGHSFAMTEFLAGSSDAMMTLARDALTDHDLLIVDAPGADMLQLADMPAAAEALIFNVSIGDDALRNDECRRNILHTAPSYAMRTDALAQFLLTKRWTDVALISGGHPDDRLYADALKNAITKFGLRLVAQKEWTFDTDLRRSASAEVPAFTQDLRKHDVLLVADEIHDFGRYILYNTWTPRPVAGSEGISPVAWSPAVEQWGAQQMQSRFQAASGRQMRAMDYTAWAAVRTIGEAVTRTGANDAATLRDYILSPAFELAGFKGRAMSYRHWNGQLRQPIPLVHPRGVVATAPLDGFLHPVSELDTLGRDVLETDCTTFEE